MMINADADRASLLSWWVSRAVLAGDRAQDAAGRGRGAEVLAGGRGENHRRPDGLQALATT